MYEATKLERKALQIYNYSPEAIDLLDLESDKVRRGIAVGIKTAIAVCTYQSDLQLIKKSQKRWWHFWK